MKLKEAFPELFRRPVPVVAQGTTILVAGTLLDTPRRDVLPIVRSSDKTLSFVSNDGKHLIAFAGQAILSKLVEWNPRDHRMFLFEPIENACLQVLPIPADEEIASLFHAFVRTKFGWSIIDDHGTYAIATLSDLIPLYSKGALQTSLCARDIASPVFSLPQDTKLSKAIQEMIRRSVRRVFLSDTNRFVSDREILTYIFSPARLAIVRNSPHEMLEATLEDVGSVEAINIDGSATLREASELFKPSSGAWCLKCREGVITPWDLVVKPWKMGQLIIRDGMEIEQSQKENKRRDFEIITVSEFVEDLKKQGYDIKINAQIKGKSGLVHQVDGLAIHAKNGNRIIVWLEKRGDTTTEIIQIFAIAYDAGADPCYVADRELGEEERKLAEYYKMKLLAKV